MKILLSRIILACSFLLQPISIWATAPDFDEAIDKLLLVTNGHRCYIENWTHLMKENDPEAQNFIKHFMIPKGGDKVKEPAALLDFYVDRIYIEIVERSLEQLKTLYHSDSVNKNFKDLQFQKKLSSLGKDLVRTIEIGSIDAVEQAEKYLPSICPSFEVVESNQQFGYAADPKDGHAVKGREFLITIRSRTPSQYTHSTFANEFYEFFQNCPVVVHYYRQAMKYADMVRTLDVFRIESSSFLDRNYNGPIGIRSNFVLDRVHDCIFKPNKSFLQMKCYEEARLNDQLDPKKINELTRLQKLHQGRKRIIFLEDESSFIQKEVETIFPKKTSLNDNEWMSSPLLNQWKKTNSQQPTKNNMPQKRKKKVPAKKNQRPLPVKVTIEEPKPITPIENCLHNEGTSDVPNDIQKIALHNKQEVLAVPTTSVLIPIVMTSKAKQVQDYWFLRQMFPENVDVTILRACMWFHFMITQDEISDEETAFDFDDWYRDHVTVYQVQKQSIQTNKSSTTLGKTPLLPSFYKEGADFLKVVWGEGYQNITVKHFSIFLKQAGGAKVKMTQRGYVPITFADESVETTYMLPNLNENWKTVPFFLRHVHQPHPASNPFPKKTLYNFIKRDLISAGYTKEKLGLKS